MGKIDEYASGRNDGLQLALKIVEEDGGMLYGKRLNFVERRELIQQ